MKIRCTNKATKAVVFTAKDGARHEVQFENSVATVDADTGQALVAAYPDAMEVVEEKKKVRTSSQSPNEQEE